MIYIRAIVQFKEKYIVREIRAGNKILIESTSNSNEYYLVGADDVVISL